MLLRKMNNIVVCLVLRATLAKLKNSKMNGTGIGSRDVWGLDNALLD